MGPRPRQTARGATTAVIDDPFNVGAGVVVACVLAADGLMHAYWATGGIWPAANRLSLVQAVLNSDKVEAFRPTVLVPLAAMLLLGALTVLARVGVLGGVDQIVPAQLLQAGTIVVAVALLLRGVVGAIWTISLSKSTPFYMINLVAYTPACLLLCGAAVAAAAR